MKLAGLERHVRWRRVDPRVAGGVFLMISAAALQLAVVAPLEARHATLVESGKAAMTALARDGGRASSAPESSRGLQMFYASFPKQDSSPQWLDAIDAAAARHGIALSSGEYRLEPLPAQRLLRYRMTLPVSGSYAQIRGFMDEVLQQVPAIAIEDIQLRRDPSAGGGLTAGIRMALHLSAEPAP